MRKAGSFTRTENGVFALNSTGAACLDFFGTVGSLREAQETRICALFSGAFQEDPLFATKIVFYARDIRGGLGERRMFRTLLRYITQMHPGALVPNLDLIGLFGRYDDIYCLIGTPAEDAIWVAMKARFGEDLKNLNGKIRFLCWQNGSRRRTQAPPFWMSIKFPDGYGISPHTLPRGRELPVY